TDADALAGLPPPRDVLAHGVDHTDHLVPRDAREGDAGPEALLGHRVAVTDAAGLNLDPHGPWSRVGYRALDDLEGPAGAKDLGAPHRGHGDVLSVSCGATVSVPVSRGLLFVRLGNGHLPGVRPRRRVTRARREPKSAQLAPFWVTRAWAYCSGLR